MTQTELLDTIRAEIERRREANKRQYILSGEGWQQMCDIEDCLVDLLSFLDTLNSFADELQEPEVDDIFKKWGTTKEEYLAKSMDKVHLEMELATYLQDWQDDEEIGLHLSTDSGDIQIELDDVRDLARHFYELGKNAK